MFPDALTCSVAVARVIVNVAEVSDIGTGILVGARTITNIIIRFVCW
jgi:hypothetical protein